MRLKTDKIFMTSPRSLTTTMCRNLHKIYKSVTTKINIILFLVKISLFVNFSYNQNTTMFTILTLSMKYDIKS